MRRAVLIALAVSWAPPALAHLSRPENRDPEPLQYDLEDRVLVYPTPGGRVLVHYVIEGRNGVGLENLDGDAVVDRVERIGAAYDRALEVFTATVGFEAPRSDEDQIPQNGGDDRIDVYVLDVDPTPGGILVEGCAPERAPSCWGFILHPVHTTDDERFAQRELFRLILAGYYAYFDRPLELGTASWAAGDPSALAAYLTAPERTLGELDGPAGDGGVGPFLIHLAQRRGRDPIRALWREIAAAPARPDWRLLLDEVLNRQGGSLDEEFTSFALDNADRGARLDALGDELPELAPLSARYFRIDRGTVTPTPADLGPLRISRVDTLLTVINPSLSTIGASRLENGEGGCTCASGPRAGPFRALALGLLLLVRGAPTRSRSGARRRSPRRPPTRRRSGRAQRRARTDRSGRASPSRRPD